MNEFAKMKIDKIQLSGCYRKIKGKRSLENHKRLDKSLRVYYNVNGIPREEKTS